MSLLATALAVATILAPIVGSSIAAVWDWRVTFAASPVLGLVVLLMSVRFLAETKPARNGYESIRTQIANSWRAFISNSSSLWGTTLVSLSFAGYMAFLASAAPVLEKVYHQPIVAIGPLYASTIVPYVAGVWLARHLVASRSAADVVRIGALIFVVVGSALAPLSIIGAAPLVLLWGLICVYMFGLGLIFPNATAIVMQPVPNTAGFVSSILGVFQVGTAAIVSGLVVFLFDGSIRALAAMLSTAALLCAAVVFLRRG
jgi:DHA1 family bicyclomycin/chloramphenicol resistance-like MFS transporter